MSSLRTHTSCAYLLLLAALLLALSNVQPALGQAISGDLVGTVIDPSGATVPNATVEATNDGTNVKSSTTTGANGTYRLSNLQPGTYTLNVSGAGFATTTLKNVRVALNQVATANVSLQISRAATTVNVTEAAAVIDTTTAQIQSTYEAQAARDLPSAAVGQGVLNLSLLDAGVSSSGGTGAGTGPSVGGQRPRNNNFTVDGVDNNSKSVTGPQVYVPNDAVAEFTLLQNIFSPEYGHSSGGQFNTIVKSGTNEFHGSLYEYLRNRDLNALDQTFKRQGIFDRPRYDQNRLGATIGGPIIHDKLFFFGNFEYNPLGQASTQGASVYTPTAQGYSLLAGIPNINQTNLNVLKQYATPAATASDSISVAGVSVPVGILPVSAPNYQNAYYAVGSVDYNISDRDQLRGRFIYNKYSFIDTAATLPAFYTTVPATYYLASIAEYHTFSPMITNEFRLGYNRQNQDYPAGNFSFPGLDSFPNLTFDELNLQLGPDPNAPQFGISNLYQGTDNLTWTKGSHTFKFGTEFRKSISPQSFTQRSRGDYEWSNLEGYLLDITPDFAQRSLGNVIYYGDQISTYNYFNDNWRMRPNLSFNLGIRYEYNTVPYTMRQQTLNQIASVPGVLEFGEPKYSKNNWAPRIGFAYSPGTSGKTSIRGGFGMAYDVLFDNIGLLALPPQLSTTVDVSGAGNPDFLKNGGILPTASGGPALTADEARAATSGYIPENVKTPYSIQWNLSVQHVFKQNYTFEARYLGTRGVHLFVQTHPNVSSVISPAQNIPTYLSMPDQSTLNGLQYTLGDLRAMSPIMPQFAAAGFTNTALTEWSPQGYSRYNGLALQLTRRFSNGLQFVGAYTWSHLIDNSTAEFATTFLTPRRPEYFQNMAKDQADSALDRRQRFTFSAIYDVPWFKDRNWLMKNLVGNWEIAPIYTFETGQPWTPQSLVDANLNGDRAPDRTIVNPSGVAGTASLVYGVNRAGQQVAAGNPGIVAYVAQNPNARYIQAQLGAYTNAGRNTEHLPHINNWDVTLLKRFSIGERWKLELAGQAFNLFNHPQYIAGYVNDVGSIGSFTNSALALVNVQNSAFGQPDQVFSSSPRVLQVFLKVRW
jgi:uncharacterized protein (UPF0333 family)